MASFEGEGSEMDSSSAGLRIAITPYVGGSHEEDDSLLSCARTSPLNNGDNVKLMVPGFGEVGVGIIVEARPIGEWRGVVIPLQLWVFVLVRPQTIVANASILLINPSQRGFRTMSDVLNRTMLWRAYDVEKSSGDPQMDAGSYIRQEDWYGLEVHRMNSEGTLLSSGRINCWRPDDHFQETVLGPDNVGVTVLDVFVGGESIMTHERWPIVECSFPNGRSLKETLEYFASLPHDEDPLAYLGGRPKARYRFIVRSASTILRESQYAWKTTDEEVRRVSAQRCCDNCCCQIFPSESTLLVRKKFWVKSFEERREYGIAVGGQLHTVDGNRKQKYITLEGAEVCGTAWYIIHGLLKSTYHNYIDKYKQGVVSTTHGNKEVRRPRVGIVQVTGTMKAIINSNADQMPHQMRGVGNGRMDILKFLPAGNNWKRIRADANEV